MSKKKRLKAPLIIAFVVMLVSCLAVYAGVKGVGANLFAAKNDNVTADVSVSEDTVSEGEMFVTEDTVSDSESVPERPTVTYDGEHIVVSYNGEWEHMLVNRWNSIPEGYEIDTVTLDNGKQVDSRIYEDLRNMFDDARAKDVYPYVTEAFRSTEDQQGMMKLYIERYIEEGYDEETAKEMAEAYVALPGTSEHQLGLALDINADTNISGDNEAVYGWLAENAYRYGFILRYPEGKEDITGISYEPWHYRYVGKEFAEEIHRDGLCLEEYLQKKYDPDHKTEPSDPEEQENDS